MQAAVLSPDLFSTIPCPSYPEIRLATNAWASCGKKIRELDPDAVHIATEGPVGMAARNYCVRKKIPFTTSFHTQFPEYVKARMGLPVGFGYGFLKWFHRRAERTLVTTKTVETRLRARGFKNMVVWTRGVDHSVFRTDLTPRLQDLPKPIFMYVGRIAVEKNLEAFLKLDLPGTKVCVGDGPARASLEKKFPKTVFPGYRTGQELAEHIAASDVFVFPSLTDTFGVVMIEAMGVGTPVAAFPVQGPIDVVEPGLTGILDKDLQKASLEALKLDRTKVKEAAKKFTWDRCAEIFYNNLAVR
jgi:glycosyltransferase involved in cell wall biosynthesis